MYALGSSDPNASSIRNGSRSGNAGWPMTRSSFTPAPSLAGMAGPGHTPRRGGGGGFRGGGGLGFGGAGHGGPPLAQYWGPPGHARGPPPAPHPTPAPQSAR